MWAQIIFCLFRACKFVLNIIIKKFSKEMVPEKEVLIKTLQELQRSIREGDKTKIKKITECFHQNLARNKQLLSELYTSRTRCTTQTDLILAACQNKKADILFYILKETDMLIHLTDDSFDDTEVNKQRAEAMSLVDFNMIEMLYDFWCGNLHWSGYITKNIEMVGNVLQSASAACSDYDDQLEANFHCLLTFNAFQREIYPTGPKSSAIEAKEAATLLLKVLRIYDEYSHIEKIRRKHTNEELEQLIQANINDESSTFYINLEYIYYEVYFRKLDFNVSLLILENLFVLRNHLRNRFNKKEKYFNDNPNMRILYKNAANTYEEIESAIYHFIYCTSEYWRLYLPEKRQIIIEEHTVIHEGRQKTIKLTLDLHKLYNGPVICFERESLKESFEKLKIILEEYVIPEDPALNNKNDTSNVETLLNENYLKTISYMRDHYSIIKIVYYIEAIENTADNDVLMVERVLHVVGEMLKSTDESHHLSRSTQALIQTAISVETISHLQNIRNFLSHAREGQLSTRINMAKTQTLRFKKIKEELIMIKQIINPILDIFKSILDKSLLEKGLRLLEQRIEGLPDEAKCRVDDIYRLYKIHKKELVLESGKYYQDDWRHTGLTLQLLKEIPWIMQNKAKILTDIQLAKTSLSDKVARKFLSLTPYVRQILELIIDNHNNVKTINQYDKSVQMSECPDTKEITEIRRKLKTLMKRNKSLNVDLKLLNKIKNYKDQWESVKVMLSFCLTECELFAPIKGSLTNTPTVTEAYNILAEMEVISVMHRSTLAWLTGRRAVVLGLRKYRKCEDWIGWLFGLKFNQKHFEDIETLHNDQIASKKIKPADPRLAREKLIFCLINRLDLLKQTLLYVNICQQYLSTMSETERSVSPLMRRFDHDVKFRITIEMTLADIGNVLAECNIRLMNKSSMLLRDINLGNVLDHGNPFLEVIGDIFNSHDLAAEWLDKAMMFAEDSEVESIKAVYKLFQGKMDYRTILAGDLLTMDNNQKKLYAQFQNSPNWKSYALLTRYTIPKSQRPKI